MEISTEPLENRQLRLTITVDEERAQQAMQQAARQIARRVNIPGFRKGKAPYERVVQRYGENAIRKEAAEALLEAVYGEALEQEQITPYAAAALEEVELSPIRFTFTVPLPPSVDLGAYRDYRLAAPPIEVAEDQVQQALDHIREQNAIFEQVDRPAALEDGVAVDVVGQTAEGVQFLQAAELRLILEPTSAIPAPGFAEAVVGMKAGEERTFTLMLPDDFGQEELRGRDAQFTVKMTEVYESTLPGLDDDLARTVGSFDSLEELKQHIRQGLEQAVREKADEAYASQVLEAIVEQAQVEYPPIMLERQLEDLVKDFEQAVKQRAQLSLEDYLRVQHKTLEELREELRPLAASRLRHALVLGKVATLERLEVNEEEIGTRIEETSLPWGARADQVRASLSSDTGRQAVHSRLLANKAVQRLVAIARGEAPELAPVQEAEEQGSGGAEEQESPDARKQEAGSEQVEEG